MLQPKQTKYRKQHKMRNRGLAHAGSKVSFGDFGLKSKGVYSSNKIKIRSRAAKLQLEYRLSTLKKNETPNNEVHGEL